MADPTSRAGGASLAGAGGAVTRLGRVGLWSTELRFGDRYEALAAALEAEQLGYGTLWIPGGSGGDLLETVEEILTATTRIVVATGILNIWGHDAPSVTSDHARLDDAYPGRFVLGLGVGHPSIEVDRYRNPLTMMREFLQALDDCDPGHGSSRMRVLAALSPRMVELARTRTLGVHSYMVPVEHTRWTRQSLGSDHWLAPELSVVLGPDVDRARDEARRDLALYLTLENYVKMWRRFEVADGDLEAGGSDRLIDMLYALGTARDVAKRVAEHHAAGADHVCIRVVTNKREQLPRFEWRALAAELLAAQADAHGSP